jgi:hypothetical protein
MVYVPSVIDNLKLSGLLSITTISQVAYEVLCALDAISSWSDGSGTVICTDAPPII